MDCSEVKKRIDEMSLDRNPEQEKKVLLHLQDCPSCRKYYEDHLQMMQVVSNLRNQQPELKHPDSMKSAILSSMENERNTSGRKIFPILFLTRFLAAASVVLLVTLGIEQYTVLKKVQHLEIQLGKVEQPASTQQVKIYKSSLLDLDAILSGADQNMNLKKMMLLLQMRRFEDSDFTYKDLKRNISKDKNIEKLIRSQQQELKKQKP